MISLNALKEREKEVAELTCKEFPETASLSENAIELLLNMIQIASDEKAVSTKEHGGYSVFILANRSVRLLSCAHNAIVKGYYDVGMGILRFAFETHLLMNYLSNKNEEAKRWLDGKIFKPSYLKSKVTPSYHEVYSLLSGFAHPNVSTCKSYFFDEIGGEQSEFFIGGLKKTHFLYSAKHLIAIEWGTIALVSTEFAPAFVLGNQRISILERLSNWVSDYRTEMVIINHLLKLEERARGSACTDT